MSEPRTAEILVAVHVDNPDLKSVRVSNDGVDANAVWIVRTQITSLGATGQHTRGTDRYGNHVRLPLANLVIPEWLAKKVELI